MIRKYVRYMVKSEARAKVMPVIAAFVDEIARREPETIYGAFEEESENVFIHMMAFPDAASEQAHRTAAHTKAFVDELYPNCVEPPQFVSLSLIRSTKRGGGFLGMSE